MSDIEEQGDNVTFFNDTPSRNADVGEYARQLSERKRLEEAKRREDRLLRRSLRQSERLRQLATAKKIAKDLRTSLRSNDNLGFDEEAFDVHPDPTGDVGAFIRDLRRAMGRQGDTKSSSDIDDLSDAEWEWLANAVSNKTVLQAFNLYDVVATVMEKMEKRLKYSPRETWAAQKDSLSTVNAILHDIHDLPPSRQTKEMEQLLQIITGSEMKALFVAHDGVALVWDAEAVKAGKKKKKVFDPAASIRSAVDSVKPTPERKDPTSGVERTVYTSPVEGCYKILAVDDQGKTVFTPDGTTLVNVVLQKDDEEYFGGTVRSEGSAIVIGRIISGGLMEKTGLLNEGDELLSVNGINLVGKDVDHVSDILTRMPDGQIELLVAPILPITEAALYNDEPVAHLRALYSYEPSNDLYNPCREASILFDKGDILRVLNTRDPNWWQVLRIEEAGAVGVSGSMAGLMPSPYFQRFRSLIRLRKYGGLEEDAAAGYSESEESDFDLDSGEVSGTWNASSTLQGHNEQGNRGAPSPGIVDPRGADPIWSAHGMGPKQMRKQRSKKLRKTRMNRLFSNSTCGFLQPSRNKNAKQYELSIEMNAFSQADDDQLRQLVEESMKDSIRRPSLLTYELVDLYYPQPQRRRPLVLVGPTHVGRQQLIEALVRDDGKRFAMPDIHTTNPEASPTEFQRYEKVNKEDFQFLQRARSFIEWGAYDQHFYGTKTSSIEAIIKAGKVCITALRPDSIRAIRRTSFLPCVIFVSPPDNLEDLRKLRKNLGQNTSFSDEELKRCIDESQKMEQHYGHFFEFVITPQSRDEAIGELRQIALSLERRPQWVPAHWVDLAWRVAATAGRQVTAAAAAAAAATSTGHSNGDANVNADVLRADSGTM